MSTLPNLTAMDIMNKRVIGATGCHFIGSLAGPHADDCLNHGSADDDIRRFINILRINHGPESLRDLLRSLCAMNCKGIF